MEIYTLQSLYLRLYLMDRNRFIAFTTNILFILFNLHQRLYISTLQKIIISIKALLIEWNFKNSKITKKKKKKKNFF